MDKVTMSVQEMAMQMGISLSKAYALTREADFPIVRVGKRVLIPVSEFKVWLSARATENDAPGKNGKGGAQDVRETSRAVEKDGWFCLWKYEKEMDA